MSLRLRILLLVLAATLLPVLVMTWLLVENRTATVVEARDQLTARADSIAHDLEDEIAGTIQLLFGLARAPVLESGNKNACSTFLLEVLQEHPQFSGILTIKPDGTTFCDSLHTGRTLNVSDRFYFQQAKDTKQVVIEPVIGRLSGKGVVQVAYPVHDSDRVLHYILLASLDMDKYGQKIANGLALRSMHFQIWNRDGSIIMDYLGPDAQKFEITQAHRDFVLSPKNSGTLKIGSGANALIMARADLPGNHDTGLHLVLAVPERDLKASIDSQFKQSLFLIIGISSLIFVGGAILGEYAVRRQTIRLMQAISRLDAGVYTLPIGEPYPRGELGQVMRALDRMGDSLEAQREVIALHTETLERQARIDSLTGLANRHMLTYRLDQTLSYARRHQRVAGVLMLDLDRFKNVNDTLGHAQGDELLREVARRLKSCTREDDTVARLGGDEFVIILADMANSEDITPVAQKILTELAKPIKLECQSVTVTTSLGVALFPRDGDNSDALLRFADTAMYRAKEEGGNAYTFFTTSMMQNMLERIELERGLRHAIDNNELRLHFQPIVDAKTGLITSAEALVRWQHPERGLVPPVHFIPLAEETGLIVPLGDWVLHQACAQAVQWQKDGLGDIPIAINISARQFNQPALDEFVAQALRVTGCPAHLLMLEITESSIMDHVDQALAIMHRLTTLGVQLMIDDFGTGYSSLSQLKRFPVSTLKIDASFVRDILEDADDDAIVDAIITLAQKLGLRTVAEGVETQVQVDFLATRGCDKYQGYFFAKPCEADVFAKVTRERNGV
ncbi:MAG: EAL domain-containing protein [Rhodocyclaceae bacterium]|nr:EAL domain-containing protein [Rhodocyclaceae bacterium]